MVAMSMFYTVHDRSTYCFFKVKKKVNSSTGIMLTIGWHGNVLLSKQCITLTEFNHCVEMFNTNAGVGIGSILCFYPSILAH